MSFHDEQVPVSRGRVLLFVLACILAATLPIVAARALFAPDDPGTSQRRLAPITTATATTAPSTAASPAPDTMASAPVALAAEAETCRLANLRHKAPVSAAEVSMAQFDKHIDAMNLLVAGKISLSVATTFWDETRVKAVENAEAFRRADRELVASRPTCPVPDPAVANDAPYGQVVMIRSCARAMSAHDTALARARTAVSTWEHHIHDMEKLRKGQITPAQATAAWRKSWKVGEKQLTDYEKASAKAVKIHCSLD